MKKNLGAKPLIYPQPVLIIATYNDDGSVDAMNAAWGGVGDDRQVFLCLSENHRTVDNMKKRGAFTVHIATETLVAESDYFGIVSANETADKFKKSRLYAVKSEFVDAPVITEYPIALECSFVSYEPEHCHCFGDIVNTCVDEDILTGGKVDVSKLKPITFDIDNSMYIGLGNAVAEAFSTGIKFK